MVRKNLNNLGVKVLLWIIISILSIVVGYSQNKNTIFNCRATYYHNKFENRRTASGEIFSQKLYTAAHKTLPLQTIVKVTNNRTNKTILVKINDRCGRNGIIDMSKTSADKIGLNGSESVTIEVLGKDYIDIWNQQNVIISNNLMSDSLRTSFTDSLIDERKITSDYLYYVRVTTVEGSDNAEIIRNEMNEHFNTASSIEKVYNENFFHINIGPFPTQNEANLAIKELKKKYPLAHLLKKKNR